MMQLNVLHRTSYRFTRPLTNAIQLLRLTPTSCLTQTVLDWRIDVGCDARLRETHDGYGNCVHMLYVDDPVSELVITATGRVITENRAGVVEGLANDLPHEVFLRSTALTAPEDGLRALAAEVLGSATDPLSRLHALNALIQQRMTFDPGVTGTATPAAKSYEARRGVCQDFAHIFIAGARLCEIPARYVSGHLFRKDDSAQDAGHAWAEAWVPALGWIAFDPAHGICADDAYIRIAAGLDYGDAAPVAGTRRGGGTESMSVEVMVSQPSRHPHRQHQKQSQTQSRQHNGDQSRSQTQG
ncbi:MAG: transglutaminase family protein [Sphingomicrobium sp.]